MDLDKLKLIIQEKGITQKEMAKRLDVSVSSVNAKLNHRSSFNVNEVGKIIKMLNLENPEDIFSQSISRK